MDIEFIRTRPTVYSPNRSVWMLTVGTHTKKPENYYDWRVMYESLGQAIRNVLERDDFKYRAFYKISNKQPLKGPLLQTDENLRIEHISARYSVEVGRTQGRIDAHIIIDVEHRSTIQVDHVEIGRMIDAELENQNTLIGQSRHDTSTVKPLRWARPSVYMSFRRIGNVMNDRAIAYIAKNADEVTAFNDLLGQIRGDRLRSNV